jgi:hypothetical protein
MISGTDERTIGYETPFTKCGRKEDYEREWGA